VAAAAARLLIGASVLKGVGELLALGHLRDKQYNELRRSAVLLTRDLARYTVARFALLVAGVLVTLSQFGHPLSITGAALALALFVAGELVERTLFFAASSAPGMPGGLS
jgi:DMSO reductase anchor subunit